MGIYHCPLPSRVNVLPRPSPVPRGERTPVLLPTPNPYRDHLLVLRSQIQVASQAPPLCPQRTPAPCPRRPATPRVDPCLLSTPAGGRSSAGRPRGGRLHRDVISVRAWPRVGLCGPRGERRWQLWEVLARESEEPKSGPILRPGSQALILQRTERRDRPDGPLNPNRGPGGEAGARGDADGRVGINEALQRRPGSGWVVEPPGAKIRMFRFMRDAEPEDPMFLMDPFAIHRQHMSRMLSGGFGYSPFLSITDGNMPGTRPASRRMQTGAVSPFGMLGMSGGFMDMFGMMNDMIGNMEHMTAGGNCQTFSSSTVISYSNTGDGAPKVYQETSEMRSAPGGIRETRRTVRDSDSGLEQMSIGHHIRDRAHILQRSRNHRTGDQEERQDYINLDESEAAAFDDEWRRETSRFRQQRPLEFRRHEATGGGGRRAEGPPRLAIQGPEDSPSRQSRRYDW